MEELLAFIKSHPNIEESIIESPTRMLLLVGDEIVEVSYDFYYWDVAKVPKGTFHYDVELDSIAPWLYTNEQRLAYEAEKAGRREKEKNHRRELYLELKKEFEGNE